MTSNLTAAVSRWLQPLRRVLMIGLAAVLAFNLVACAGTTTGSIKDAARTAVNVAKTAADVTGNETLKSVLTPVVKVLNDSEKLVKEDDIPAATKALTSFRGLWDKAAPVVKLAAGDNYGLIDTGVKTLAKVFGAEAPPSKDNALSALAGLIKPLSALLS